MRLLWYLQALLICNINLCNISSLIGKESYILPNVTSRLFIYYSKYAKNHEDRVPPFIAPIFLKLSFQFLGY